MKKMGVIVVALFISLCKHSIAANTCSKGSWAQRQSGSEGPSFLGKNIFETTPLPEEECHSESAMERFRESVSSTI